MPRNPNSGEEIKTEAYLGDGVFASFDGSNVWLRAPRNGRDHYVALNIENWKALRMYAGAYLSLVRPQKDS